MSSKPYPDRRVLIETYTDDSDEPSESREINHNDDLHRKWLAKHIQWAMWSGYEVHIIPLNE